MRENLRGHVKGGFTAVRRPAALALAAAVVLVLAGGCSYTPPIAPVGPVVKPEQLPLRIGVHYTPEFRSREDTLVVQYIESYTFRLGEPSVALLDRTLALAFAEVTETDGIPPFADDGPELDVVVEPYFAEFTPEHGSTNPSGFGYILRRVTLGYGFRFYAMDGKELTSWEVRGFAEVSAQGRVKHKSYSTGSPYLDAPLLPLLLGTAIHDATSSDVYVGSVIFGEATEIAMSTAAHQFLLDVQEIPELQHLMQDRVAD